MCNELLLTSRRDTLQH